MQSHSLQNYIFLSACHICMAGPPIVGPRMCGRAAAAADQVFKAGQQANSSSDKGISNLGEQQ